MYNQNYFNDRIFDTDYSKMASIILSKYNPKSIAEFGCGNGYLTNYLSLGCIKIFAIDGYSQPKFKSKNIEFLKVDLNNELSINSTFKGREFDIAICMEVAEHLLESSSDFLVKHLTRVAPVIIFSAAIPKQGGHGHINCQTREYWYNIFSKYGYIVQDTLRSEFRKSDSIASWYKFNTLVFVRGDYMQKQNDEEVIKSLIASESASTSAYYKTVNETVKLNTILNYLPIKLYLQIRDLVKKIVSR